MTTLALPAAPSENPMWDAVRPRVRRDTTFGYDAGLKVGGLLDLDAFRDRFTLTEQYAWTITAPDTVTFVAQHLGPRAFDPLAGTGYWAALLRRHGVDIIASDLNPPQPDERNMYHRTGVQHVDVRAVEAIDACRRFGVGRSLLLSWPPYDHPIGAAIVRAFTGDRLVYIGEMDGGCCGDDDLFELLREDWVVVDEHRPIQFHGMHDWVTAYQRRTRELPAPAALLALTAGAR